MLCITLLYVDIFENLPSVCDFEFDKYDYSNNWNNILTGTYKIKNNTIY